MFFLKFIATLGNRVFIVYRKMNTIKIKSNSIVLISIFFVALLIRLFFALNDSNVLLGDEVFYEKAGTDIMLGKGYLLNGRLTACKTPGYPIFISLLYHVFGRSFIPIRIIQALLDALICAMIYIIARRFFDEKVAILSGILCSMHYFFLKSLQLLRPDTLQMFFLVLSILYWIKWREDYLKINAILLGIFLSSSVMLKANVILLPFLIIGIELFNVIKNKRIQPKIFIKSTFIFLLIFFLPISAWSVRNYKAFNEFIPVATDGGLALYASYNPPEGKKFGILAYDSIVEESSKIDSAAKRSKYLSKKALEGVLNKPKKAIGLIPLKILFFWSVFDWETLGDDSGVYNFSTAFILPFSFLGIFLLRRRFDKIYPILWIMFYVFMMAVVFAGMPRFRMAIEPFLIIFAAFAISRFYDRFSNNKVVFLVISWFCLNFFMFLNSSRILGMGRFLMEYLRLW